MYEASGGVRFQFTIVTNKPERIAAQWMSNTREVLVASTAR